MEFHGCEGTRLNGGSAYSRLRVAVFCVSFLRDWMWSAMDLCGGCVELAGGVGVGSLWVAHGFVAFVREAQNGVL